MKKIFIVLFVFVCFIFTGCNAKSQNDPVFSLAQKDAVTASDDNFFVSVISGTRENPFVLDGKTTSQEDFTTLTVLPLHFDLFDKNYTFEIIGDKGSYQGELAPQKSGSGYVADIKNIQSVGKITEIKIKDQDTVYTFSPERKIGDFSYLDAYQKATETFASTLENERKSGAGREIVVKYVSDGKTKDSTFYWYVAFYKSENDFLSVLLDGNTGKIIAQRG